MLHPIQEEGIDLKKKGKKGNGFRRLFSGADDPARKTPYPDRSGAFADPDSEVEETAEDILAKYGKYLDEDGVPFKGINPNPKYYVVPKEPPKPVPKKATVRKVKKAKPAPQPEPAPAPKKVTVKKVKKPTKVTVKKKSKAKP